MKAFALQKRAITPGQGLAADSDLILNNGASGFHGAGKPCLSSASISVLLPDPGPPVMIMKRW